MLKFLRKYKQYLLVVGGALLMIAFLLPQTFDQLKKANFGIAPMRIDGKRVSQDEYQQAAHEYYVLGLILARGDRTSPILKALCGESADHWVLLKHEAQRSGLAGGPKDGEGLIPEVAQSMVAQSPIAQYLGRDQLQGYIDNLTESMTAEIPKLAADERIGLTEDKIYQALGSVRGVMRMRMAYARSGRYSDRRLATEFKRLGDSAGVSYAFLGPEREFSRVTEPKEEQIVEQYTKLKDVSTADNEFGLGYRLADRTKIEWMKLDRVAISESVNVDPVEVHKRVLKAGSPPQGQTPEQFRQKFEQEVRQEQTEKAMRAAAQAVSVEIERALRRTEPDGEYRKLPADWAQVRPSFEKIRQVVVDRVRDITGSEIPAPPVWRKDAGWLGVDEVEKLEGIGTSELKRGNLKEPFGDYVFKVREIAGNNDYVLQAGVPGEPTTDGAGNQYYFIILEARKKSPPDSIEEVRSIVVTDLKKLAAFDLLKADAQTYHDTVAAQGLEALNAPKTSQDGHVTVSEKVEPKNGTVRSESMQPADPVVDYEEFRKAVLEAASKIDPTAALDTVDGAVKTVVVPLKKSLGLAVARITSLSPLTIERYRASQAAAIRELQSREIGVAEDDPFSLKSLETRLNVKYRHKDKKDESGKSEPAS